MCLEGRKTVFKSYGIPWKKASINVKYAIKGLKHACLLVRCFGEQDVCAHLAPVSCNPEYIHADGLSGLHIALVTGAFCLLLLALGPGGGFFSARDRTVFLRCHSSGLLQFHNLHCGCCRGGKWFPRSCGRSSCCVEASCRWHWMASVHGSGEGNPVRPLAVRVNTRGGAGVGEGITVSRLCPCFSAGVWGGVGGGFFGCVYGRWTCL